MKILVTGANGFIGKNLVVRLRERADTEVLTYVRGQDDATLSDLLARADAVCAIPARTRSKSINTAQSCGAKTTIPEEAKRD